jgi:predicted dehydrogenase
LTGQIPRAVLIGAGKVGAAYASNARLTRHYQYISHAQVLSEHPGIDWVAVVDPDETAREAVRQRYGLPYAAPTASELPADCQPDLAVLAVPPDQRHLPLKNLPTVAAVVVEKPLGRNLAASEAFAAACRERGLLTQVNFWRRADQTYEALASGDLAKRVGEIQFINAYYCNGLRNNGSHIVDFVRMLAGEVDKVQLLGRYDTGCGGQPDDIDVAFALTLQSGISATFHPLDAACYRENGLDIWGTRGRLSIVVEGLVNLFYSSRQSRSIAQDGELALDQPEQLPSTVGHALWRLYDNLLAALNGDAALYCPLDVAMGTERVIAEVEARASKIGKLKMTSVTGSSQ